MTNENDPLVADDQEPFLNEGARDWRLVQAWALLLAAVALISTIPITGVFVPPVVIVSLVFVLAAGSIWRWTANRWVSIVGIALVILAIIGNLPFLIEDLSHPDSAGSFVPSAITLVAAIASLIAGGISLRAQSGPPQAYSFGWAAAGLAIVGLSLILSATAASDDLVEGDTKIAADGFEYPEQVEANADGGEVGLFLVNSDRSRHTFVIDSEDVKIELPASKSQHVDLALAPGQYTFHCDVPGHEDMEGVLTVS